MIDVTSAACRFNGASIPPLSIAGELQAWYREELATHNIPAEGIRSATVLARIDQQIIDRKARRTNAYFSGPGKSDRSRRYYQWQIACESTITTDETEYCGKYDDIEECPEHWPGEPQSPITNS